MDRWIQMQVCRVQVIKIVLQVNCVMLNNKPVGLDVVKMLSVGLVEFAKILFVLRLNHVERIKVALQVLFVTVMNSVFHNRKIAVKPTYNVDQVTIAINVRINVNLEFLLVDNVKVKTAVNVQSIPVLL